MRYVALENTTSRGYGVGYVRCTATDVVLTNLTAFTSYQLSVRYHDADGRYSIFR